MTHPLSLARPLLLHILAAALLCPGAFGKTKSLPQKPLPPAATKPKTPEAKAEPKAPRPAPTPLFRQKQGDAPSDPSLSHRALIVPPEELLSRVPVSGPLDEEHCILLAIAKSPDLASRRAEIQNAVASRQEIKDWRNPELRLGYGSQSDDFVRHPYTDTTLQSRSDSPFPGSVFDKIVRTVTPGLNQTYSSTSSWHYQPNPNYDPLVPGSTPLEETFTGTSYDQSTSTFSSRSSEQFSTLLRLTTPHPWVKKARLERASCEIMLAEAQYLAEEDKLVRAVRRLFHDLGVEESTLKVHQKRRANFAALRTEMENANLFEFAMDTARASLNMADVLSDTQKISRAASDTRYELAKLCLLPDPSRIYSAGILIRRVLDPGQELDPAYLIELAMLYRADAVESRGRLGIAKARLAEINAAKIPWASFIDAGYNHSTRDNYSGAQDEWVIRIGIDIPIFDWTRINKRGDEYKKAALEWEKVFNAQREQVSIEVALAVRQVRSAYKSLKTYDDDVKKQQNTIKADLVKAESAATGANGFVKNLRTKYDAEDITQQLEITRYQAYSDYNKAVMNLEDAIGVRIEKALSGSLSK